MTPTNRNLKLRIKGHLKQGGTCICFNFQGEAMLAGWVLTTSWWSSSLDPGSQNCQLVFPLFSPGRHLPFCLPIPIEDVGHENCPVLGSRGESVSHPAWSSGRNVFGKVYVIHRTLRKDMETGASPGSYMFVLVCEAKPCVVPHTERWKGQRSSHH